MMSRTVVSLPDEQLRRAKARSAELGISLAEYVRRAIERELGGEPAPVDASGLFDLGDSGGSDVAGRKDAYVGEAVSGGR